MAKDKGLQDTTGTETEEEIPFVFLVKTVHSLDKLETAVKVRRSHLKLQKKKCPHTEKVLDLLTGVEEYIDGQIASLVREHPAYPWFSRIKGIGDENIAKVVGLMNIERAPHISSLWKFAGTMW